MRLVCPNCGAQYDVPLEVIPEAGRDVQCSNCGHTWFQKRVTQAAAARPERAPKPTPEPVPEPTPQAELAPDLEPDLDPDEGTDEDTDGGPIPAEIPPRSSIDPEMAELFREEREFEARQRAADGLETQPDLGLEPPAESEQSRRTRESRERMARLKGEDVAEPPRHPDPEPEPEPEKDDTELHAAAAAAAAASRRDMLPDVEEINQTLRSASEPRVVDRDAGRPSQTSPRETGSPFARGFMVVVMVAALGLGLYVATPRLSVQFPPIAPYLQSYVETVNLGRTWLDNRVTALMQQLDQMSSEAAAPADPPAGN